MQRDRDVTDRNRDGYRRIFFSFVMILSAGRAVAGGIQLNVQGATAMSMGGAFVALANNPSAIYFNPAGLSFHKGTKIMLGTTVIVSRPSFRGVSPAVEKTSTENGVLFPSYFYVTHTVGTGVGFGFGVYNPFGLTTDWPDDWVGRFLTTSADVKTFYLNPTVSFKIGKTLSVGVGLVYGLGSAELKRHVQVDTVSTEEGRLKMEGDGHAITANTGILFRPTSQWSFGVAWRGGNSLDVEGTASFTNVPSSLALEFPGGDVSTVLRLPDNLYIGVAYKPHTDWVFAVDYQWIRWSVVEDLSIDFSVETARQQDLILVGHWQDGGIIRVGGEHHLNSIWKIRGGYYFEIVPSVDEYVSPLVPEADRMGFNLGVGFKVSEDLYIDVAFLYVQSNERTIKNSKLNSLPGVPFNGTYNSTASMLGLSLEYNLIR